MGSGGSSLSDRGTGGPPKKKGVELRTHSRRASQGLGKHAEADAPLRGRGFQGTAFPIQARGFPGSRS